MVSQERRDQKAVWKRNAEEAIMIIKKLAIGFLRGN